MRGRGAVAFGGGGGVELAAEAPDQLGSKLGDDHAGNDNKFTGEHGAGFLIVGQLAGDLAILAFLIPAEAAVGDGLGADVLEPAEDGVLLGDLESLSEDDDFDETLKWTKYFGHDWMSLFPARWRERGWERR